LGILSQHRPAGRDEHLAVAPEMRRTQKADRSQLEYCTI
jgi:hypothetical protein